MANVSLLIDPAKLANPDLDLRYLVPELLAQRTGGAVEDDGYDYDDHDRLVVFLVVDDPERAVAQIRAILASERLLGNDLSSIVVRTES